MCDKQKEVYVWAEDEFRKKLIHELHEINLSLRELSGRNVVSNIPGKEEHKSYTERYFTRTVPKK